jgi:hypothetical protein
VGGHEVLGTGATTQSSLVQLICRALTSILYVIGVTLQSISSFFRLATLAAIRRALSRVCHALGLQNSPPNSSAKPRAIK